MRIAPLTLSPVPESAGVIPQREVEAVLETTLSDRLELNPRAREMESGYRPAAPYGPLEMGPRILLKREMEEIRQNREAPSPLENL